MVAVSQPIAADTIEARLRALEQQAAQRRAQVCLACFSGDWDRLFAALSIATSALATGKEVHLFFSFWAVSALRKQSRSRRGGRSLCQRLLGWALPCGPRQAPLSRAHLGGLGKAMLRREMSRHGVEDIDVLLREVKELGGHIYLCETSAELFGLGPEEIDNAAEIERCGATTFIATACKSEAVLFI